MNGITILTNANGHESKLKVAENFQLIMYQASALWDRNSTSFSYWTVNIQFLSLK